MLRSTFSFPATVNMVSARLIAAGVTVMALAAITLHSPLLVAVIAYGYVARVLTGPTLSPLGQIVTRVITPRLPLLPRPIAGTPKRFAQGCGAVLSVTALALALFGLRTPGWALIGMLAALTALEAAFAFCVGCKLYALLVRAGLISPAVCLRCAGPLGELTPSQDIVCELPAEFALSILPTVECQQRKNAEAPGR